MHHNVPPQYVLSLDMSMAFDAVPRALVRDSLLAVGVLDKDVQIIMAWLTGSTYHLQHAHINLISCLPR